MPRFLLTIHRPDGFDASLVSEVMQADIRALNDDMIAAGVCLFVAGLQPASDATTIRIRGDETEVVDGPCLPGPDHPNGFWVIETRTRIEATAWARKAARACRAPSELRELY